MLKKVKSLTVRGVLSLFLLVRLSIGELLKQIFKEKRNHTSFSLMDINPSLLGDTSTSKLTQTNIFINYYLQKEKYNEFKKLRVWLIPTKFSIVPATMFSIKY